MFALTFLISAQFLHQQIDVKLYKWSQIHAATGDNLLGRSQLRYFWSPERSWMMALTFIVGIKQEPCLAAGNGAGVNE